MESYGSLWDLISELERGNKYHISVQFFRKSGNAYTKLPRSHEIHTTPVCDAIKQKPRGTERCVKCKKLAIGKARRTKEPFGGLCINGIYEYCHPVFRGDNLCCIIYIGNILRDSQVFIQKSGMLPENPLLDTMQQDLRDEECRKIAMILENYILLLLERPAEAPQALNVAVAAVKEYVDSFFAQDITLAGLAKRYHYNQKYLGSLFKKELGTSFHDYLNRRRLAFARSMLEKTDETILDIAAKSGFNNVTYLNRIFKARYGMTPTEYRMNRKAKQR